jgi:hypothetical protein
MTETSEHRIDIGSRVEGHNLIFLGYILSLQLACEADSFCLPSACLLPVV